MRLDPLVAHASNKANFITLQNYIDFACQFLDFAQDGLQAEIVCQNEQQYRFWQFGQEGHFNISRPLNTDLLYNAETSGTLSGPFLNILHNSKDVAEDDAASRAVICNSIYTVQQLSELRWMRYQQAKATEPERSMEISLNALYNYCFSISTLTAQAELCVYP